MRIRSLSVAAFAAGMAFAAAAPSHAAGSCVGLSAAGNGLTKDIATIMSTHGLQNIIDSKGLKGQGQMKTACKDGGFLTECRSSQTACK